MALLGQESFDWMPSGDASQPMIGMGWVSNGLYSFRTTGRFGYGYALSNVNASGSTNSGGWYRPLPSLPTTLIVGAAFYVSTWSGIAEGPAIGFKGDGSSGGSFLDIIFGGLGEVNIKSNGSVILNSPIAQFQDNTWNYAEVKLVLNGVNSSLQVRINTKTIFNLTNYNIWNGGTQYTSMDAFLLQGIFAYSAAAVFFDDVYWCDSSGTENNAFLGNVRSKGSFTSGNGSTIDSTIGGTSPAATNWQSVQDPAGDEVTYVTTTTVGQLDLYEFTPNVDSATIFGIQASVLARQDDATQMAIQPIMSSSGTQVNSSSTLNLSQSYGSSRFTQELDPATGAMWLATAANAAQAGYELVTPLD